VTSPQHRRWESVTCRREAPSRQSAKGGLGLGTISQKPSSKRGPKITSSLPWKGKNRYQERETQQRDPSKGKTINVIERREEKSALTRVFEKSERTSPEPGGPRVSEGDPYRVKTRSSARGSKGLPRHNKPLARERALQGGSAKESPPLPTRRGRSGDVNMKVGTLLTRASIRGDPRLCLQTGCPETGRRPLARGFQTTWSLPRSYLLKGVFLASWEVSLELTDDPGSLEKRNISA